MIAEEDHHLGRSVGADSEALPEGGRRFGRESVLPQSTVGVQSLTHLHATVWADM